MFMWTQKWLLKFNKDKCKILHIGRNNPKHEYFIGPEFNKSKLDATDLEKDLGIFVDSDFEF